MDAGCGDGKTSEALSKRFRVVACDYSREALLILRKSRRVPDTLETVECNILHLPFESEKFIAVACVHVLSHMMEPERLSVAREIERVVSRGGYVLVEGFGRGDLRYGTGVELERSSFRRGTGIVTHYFDDGEIPLLFKGFRVMAEKRKTQSVTYGSIPSSRVTLRTLLRKG